jgi:hypothetical protein
MKKSLLHLIGTLIFMTCIFQVQAQTYVGSDKCKMCHSEKYTDWAASGHPYKFNVTAGDVGPVYPPEAINFQTSWLENLGNGTHDWGNVAGVIGGYGWKARFVGTDGHIIGTAGSAFSTGLGNNQFNFRGGDSLGWVSYHPEDVKIYNYSCFKCHTTGGDTTGTWLEGVDDLGTFSEGGIGCEACHGPGSLHATTGDKTKIDRVYEQAHKDNSMNGLSINGVIQEPNAEGDDVNFMCGTCHNRDYKAQINVSGGFIKHHEQWDEMTTTKHLGEGHTCITCHDPHKRTIWDGDGITKTCTTCHSGHEENLNHAEGITCIDCHMPFAAKSGTARGESGYKGDVRSHLFVINPSTESMFTEDGKWVKDDEERSAALSPHFACLGCHNDSATDSIPNKSIEQVAAAAAGMHTEYTADDYAGSKKCQACHDNQEDPIYTNWAASGHPYKFNVTSGDVGPVYPPEAVNFQVSWLDSLGNGNHNWGEIAGVIGGYGWKARFVGLDGHIIGTAGSAYSTGLGHNQFNFRGGENLGWASYHPDDVKIYNYSCFKCHTTGGDTTGTWLEGVDDLGTFTEGGIGCEACHGPGALHASTADKTKIDLVYEQAHQDNSMNGLSVDGVIQEPNADGDDVNFMCGTCHNRDYKAQINVSGGFIKHHEQWDEMATTKHGGTDLTCTTCHDPHKRTIWDGDGIIKTCTECHSGHEENLNHAEGITCIDCHMPFAAKSGAKRGDSGYKGDVRSHLLIINPSSESMFTEDGKWVKDDEDRSAALSPHFACLGCHNDKADDDIPNKSIEQVAAAAAGMHTAYTADDYAGSKKCQACHDKQEDPIYTNWAASGHPYKFNVTPDSIGPVYPDEAVNYQSSWLENLGDGTHDWGNVAGVIGGYGWKARFVGTDGHIIGTAGSEFSTGMAHNQFNFYGGDSLGWANYHPDDVKIYNYSCFKCHTTGGDTTGTWLEGVPDLGTFTEGGIGCEACHGPGALHASTADKSKIDKVYEQVHQDNSLGGLSIDGVVQEPDTNGDDVTFMCGTCHNRDYKAQINVSGGFIKHHEQWDEMTATKHGSAMTCITCHDPHKRTIWDGDGITKTCLTCHSDKEGKLNHSEGITCVDCHMPYAAKSGAKRGDSGFKGDVRSHLFAIKADTASMFTEDGKWVKDDEERSAALSPHFACLGCHNNDPNDNIPDKTIEEAAASAADMHSDATLAELDPFKSGFKIYPNPSEGIFYFNLNTNEPGKTSVRIYDIAGKNVYSVMHENSNFGTNEIIWNGKDSRGMDVNAGFYFVEIKVGAKTFSGKLIKR